MRKTSRLFALATTLVFMVVVVLFFGLKYPHHLHYQEQYQLFQFTGAYFWQVVSVPGGLADWLGRFFTQFFFYAWCGASIIGGLLTLIALTLWLSVRKKGDSGLLFILSFVPAVMCGLYLCDENALLGAPIAIWLALTAAFAFSNIASTRGRAIAGCVATPLLYILLGPLSVVAPLWLVVDTLGVSRKQAIRLFAIVLGVAALTLLMAWWWCPYPLKNICLGIHYFRFRGILPLWVWLAAGSALLIYASAPLPCLATPRKPRMAGAVALSLLAAATWGGTRICCDFRKENTMKYDYMARMHMWNRILLEAAKEPPMNPTTVTCLNIALAKTGRMADTMFDYYQNGPEGLLPTFQRDCVTPLTTAEAYYQIGMTNSAQRFTFEAQEAIPDYQKSARCYKRLAETNIINGDLDVARKYLNTLTHTLYYRKWAKETLTMLKEQTAIETHAELGPLRKMRMRQHDFMFSSSETDSMLGLLITENPSNTLACDYLMAWCLLNKDLERFEECLPLVQRLVMPRAWQEAYLLLWVHERGSLNGVPAFIDPGNVERLNAFMRDSQQNAGVNIMRKRYGNTYWYYYIYRYNPTEP